MSPNHPESPSEPQTLGGIELHVQAMTSYGFGYRYSVVLVLDVLYCLLYLACTVGTWAHCTLTEQCCARLR
jgi:hypothetical protein